MKYDVVVIGAGPAGSMTARDLARGGASVLLVEKRPEIGMPVRCGEATGIPGLALVDVVPWKRAVASETKGSYLYSPDGTRVELLADHVNGYVLERRIFDKQLAVEAAKASAVVRVRTYATGIVKEEGRIVGVKLKHFNDEFEVRCSVVVGADGIEGKVGRWAGIDTRTSLPQMASNLQYEMAGIEMDNPDVMEFYFGNDVCPGGYVWVFPKGDGCANVGLGTRDRNQTPKEYLDRFISEHENLSRGSVVGVNAGGVPVAGPIDVSVKDNIVLVGDSARQIDPLTGGGIYNAMHCGRLAAETILKSIETGDFSASALMEYETRWKEEIGQGLLRSLRVKEALERMTDDDLNHVARLMTNMSLGGLDVKELTTAMLELPPDMLEFIQSLM
ncbi:putative oxidoreductase/MT0587 [archaeon BMS3Abin16]|nr:putative oxidoreductase/MT0587 [archaeon BMS3Abin16]HDY74741.1 NAD(P)/FAD-dependent oxidoreductase [Euryarchaeota archaeon]